MGSWWQPMTQALSSTSVRASVFQPDWKILSSGGRLLSPLWDGGGHSVLCPVETPIFPVRPNSVTDKGMQNGAGPDRQATKDIVVTMKKLNPNLLPAFSLTKRNLKN